MKTTPPGAGMQAEAAARFSRLNKKAAAELAEQERKYKENSQTLARSQAASHKAAQDDVTLPAQPLLEASTVEETPEPAEEQPRPPKKKKLWEHSKFLYEIDRAFSRELVYQAYAGWIHAYKTQTEIFKGKPRPKQMSINAALLAATRTISLTRLSKKIGCDRTTVSYVVNHLLTGFFRPEKQPPPLINAKGEKIWQAKPASVANPYILKHQKAPGREIKEAWTRLRAMAQELKGMLLESGYHMARWGPGLIEKYKKRDGMRTAKAQAAASPQYAAAEPDEFDAEAAARGAAFFTQTNIKLEPG